MSTGWPCRVLAGENVLPSTTGEIYAERSYQRHCAAAAAPVKRLLDPVSLRALARGCAVLGAGGGGDPYLGLLQALQATEIFGPAPLVDLDELPDDSLIMPCGAIGAPTVSIEKIENGDEGARLRDHLEHMTGRRVAALMSAEIGGANGLLPISWAARMGLPVVDADGMGRAFPEVPQVTMHLAGISPSPAIMTDERGHGAELGVACDQDRRVAQRSGEPGGRADFGTRCLPAGRGKGVGRRAPDHEGIRPRIRADRGPRRRRGPDDPAGAAEREPGRAGARPGARVGP